MASCLSSRKVWYTLVVTILMVYPGSTAATRSSTTAHWVVVTPGWNLLSLPAGVANCSTHALFPTATSPAYVFEPVAGYVVRDTLRPGEGFWLRFGTADTLLVHGESLLEHSVDVDSGWNLVGAISVPINAPSNHWPWGGWLASEFFRYVPGVGFQADTLLRPGTGYWVKASGPGSISMVVPGGGPCAVTPTVEYEGKTYNTVQIGTQCWLRENLDVGTMIPGAQDQTNNGTIEKYCYNDDTIFCATYGGLYQWDEVTQYDTTQGVQGICPPGWHVPRLAEFQTLSSTLGDDGNALKAVGQGADSGAGTNTSGFSALLAGNRGFLHGYFYELGSSGFFWSSTQYDGPYSHYLVLNIDDAYVGLPRTLKYHGFSVRCLRDNLPPEKPSGPTPPDGSVEQSPGLRLEWNCADPDGHAITYDVFAGITNPPVTPVALSEPNASVGLTGLAGSTVHYWRVVARDEHGDTTTGPVWSFTTGAIGGSPCPGTPTVTYAGKTYNTVQIGAQCWLRENLDVGTMVLGDSNQVNNSVIEKYCYDNDPVNCAANGGLYQWDEAMQYSHDAGSTGHLSAGVAHPDAGGVPDVEFDGGWRWECAEGERSGNWRRSGHKHERLFCAARGQPLLQWGLLRSRVLRGLLEFHAVRCSARSQPEPTLLRRGHLPVRQRLQVPRVQRSLPQGLATLPRPTTRKPRPHGRGFHVEWAFSERSLRDPSRTTPRPS